MVAHVKNTRRKAKVPTLPTMDAFVLSTISDNDLACLLAWSERFYGSQFQPFCEWFLQVLMNEHNRRTSGRDPESVDLPIGSKEALASGLLGAFLLLEFARSQPTKNLATRILRHFTIACYGELTKKD